MKKNKKLGIFAAALTMLACALPNVSRGAGDIWSIEPYQDAETVNRDFGTTKAQPLSVGDVFKIKVRLLNRNYMQVIGGLQEPKPWTFAYVGTPGGELLATANLPKLGVWVSGKLKYAELDGDPTPAGSEKDPDKYYFTDLIFKYTVEAGDLALPIKLANPRGDGPIEVNASISGEYYLKNGRGAAELESWQLKNADGDECSLTFTDVEEATRLQPPAPNRTWDFSNPSIYIQAIDLDSNYADEEKGVWREIASGLTSSTPIDPTIVIPGGNAGTIDLYVWTKDSSVAKVVAGGNVLGVTEEQDIFGNKYQVGRVRIPATATSVSFKILAGDTAGAMTDVYLASTPTNVYDMAEELLTNFVTRTVKVITPPPPFVSVAFADGADRTIVADGNFSSYKTVLQVNLSQPFTSDVKLTLKPTVKNNASADAWKYIGISQYDNSDVYLQRESTVTVPAGSKTSAPMYVYALAADMWTRDLTNGIVIQATLDDPPAAQAFYTGTPVDATLHIDVAKPVVTMPDAPFTGTSSIQSGETTVFSVGVSDSYANLTGTYDVYLNENNSFKGTETPIATGLSPVNGVLSVPYVFISTGLVTSRIKVRNSAGIESAVVSFEVNGLAPRSLKGEPADGNVDKIYAEGKEASIRATFEPAFSLATEAYVFLEPQDEASSNKVSSLNFERGVRIQNGQAAASVPLKLSLLDGTVATETSGLRYKIKIRTAEKYDEGNEIEGYTSADYNIFVTNVVPRVDTVYMGGIWQPELNADGKLIMAGQAAVGVRKVFTYVPADGEVDADLTNGTFTAKWTFYDGAGFTTNVVGSPYEVQVPYTFVNGGRQRVTVELQDKDLHDLGAMKFGPKYEFYVNVVDTPSVELSPRDGSQVFTEAQNGDKGVINVRLTLAPDAPVKVQLKVTRNGADNGNYPLPGLSTTELDFARGVTERSFNLKDLDGTEMGANEGYRITAKVITETKNADGIRYCDLYLPATDFSIYISNVPPEIILPDPADTNVYVTTLSKEEIIRWNVKEVAKNDILSGDGLIVTIMNSEGAYTVVRTHETSGVYTNKFTASGSGKWVSVQVQDKDGGSSVIAKKFFEIAAGKPLAIWPQGPFGDGENGGGQSDLAKAYIKKAGSKGGLGKGRVWAVNDARPQIDHFLQTWTFTEGVNQARVKAYGYRVGDVDNKTLNGGEGFGVTAGGSIFEGTSPYTYANPEEKDSFFFGWILDTVDEGGLPTGTAFIDPRVGVADQMFKLPDDEDDAESYASTWVEVLFSLEWHKTDNVGDINQDAVPDLDASDYKLAALAGQAEQGGGAAAGSETEATEMVDVSKYNGDDDWLPAAFGSNPLNPEKPGWGKGKPFTAKLEIRGLGDGLNRIKNGVASDPWLSEAETNALMCAYVAAKKAGGASADDLVAAAADINGALTWLKGEWKKGRGGWNVERPTDPTVADTDGDGLDDGFEYFFWYFARVGIVQNGEWRRLTGSRYNPMNPGQGTPISSEEIVAAFDPLVARPELENDFDGDGLTDEEEYTLGTNPCSWDSDGDGVSDYYEVMAGTDPLDKKDGGQNPDGDFMARMDSEVEYTIITTAEGRKFCVPVLEGGIALTASTNVEAKTVWTVKTLEGGSKTSVYFTLEKPVLVNDTYLALGDDNCWKAINVGTDKEPKYFLGAEATLAPGVQVVEVSDDAAEQSFAETTGFVGGLELFRYGSDADGIWVPCVVDGAWMDQEFDKTGKPVEKVLNVVAYETNAKISYLHHQVYQQAGFDPRTAWNKNDAGYVASRWQKPEEGDTGLAVNTVPYTTRDEYLLISYCYNVVASTNARGNPVPFTAHRSAAQDAAEFKAGAKTMAEIIMDACTKPTPAFAQKDASSSENEEEATVVVNSWKDDVHGADTDGDGIPDGWELYVDLDPTLTKDGAWTNKDLDILDDDLLPPVHEFAGVDSCNAYTNVPSIYQNHPGVTKGWWNKFFPTDPLDEDTDGDHLVDGFEGATTNAPFYVGRTFYAANQVKITFVYGQNDSYLEDMDTTCFRGGGLNPCSVDTDQDLLPDAWEWQFAGVVFNENGMPVNVALEARDVESMHVSDGLAEGQVVSGYYISGGMDGTWGKDAYGVRVKDDVTGTYRDTDWDHDGLQNYQEYLVQSLRHLRYDDAETPLMGRYLNWDEAGVKQDMPFIGFIPMQTWDGEAFKETCLKAGYKGASDFDYARLGYFARPAKSWDRLAQCTKGLACNNYSEPGYRIMLPPAALNNMGGWTMAAGYATTDPRQWDSDNDGMDDYYELFHGLNPLLGSASNPSAGNLTTAVGVTGVSNLIYDRIANIYGEEVTSWYNAWTRWDKEAFDKPGSDKFDAMKYPWMIGTAECDADGDGIRNADEALFVNDVAPAAAHTDPTPLWMTDSSSKKSGGRLHGASFVAQYYQLDPTWGPYADLGKLWDRNTLWIKGLVSEGQTRSFKFAFEENEGYDTDGDFSSDATEKTKKIVSATDALYFGDPDRRQAMWFPGRDSALASFMGTQLRPNSYEYDMLKQFTVEAWICPEDVSREQVILERVAYYDASTLSNNVAAIRRNFRIGIELDADGQAHLYGEFQGRTVDSGVAHVALKQVLVEGKWVHVALSFDGSTLALYLDDEDTPSAHADGVTVIPANGVNIRLQEAGYTSTRLEHGYSTVPCAMLVGAEALDVGALSASDKTTWNSFGSFFKGYVDEVRIWDGARSGVNIRNDVSRRYSLADVKAHRDAIFNEWVDGARRYNGMSPELLQVYNFTTMPGAVDEIDVVAQPTGFAKGVTDNVRINGKPVDLEVGWWSDLSVHSTVYTKYEILPRIQNLVGHLPVYDGSALDTEYWSANFAGVKTAPGSGFSSFLFPNTANPYSFWNYCQERFYHMERLGYLTSSSNVVTSVKGLDAKYEFDLRSGFVGTGDLVPLGGAFAKRAEQMWDGYAADAWDQTGTDMDGNGLPDWWEEVAAAYGAPEKMDATTLLNYNGEMITAAEAYLRDLALGMLPGGSVNPAFNTERVDSNGDGLPDTWQKIYGLLDQGPQDDADGDQLSNYAEYMISDWFKFRRLDPKATRTFAGEGQKVPDYFLKVGKLYLGEMFSDHDMIEDWWEDSFKNPRAASRFAYDAQNDWDDDGWSLFAEARAGTDPTRISSLSVDAITQPDYPVPVVQMTVKYNGAQDVASKGVIVQAFRKGDTSGKPDALWRIEAAGAEGAGSNSDENVGVKKSKLIGANPNREVGLTLGPGSVVAGTVTVEFKDVFWHHVSSVVRDGVESIFRSDAGDSSTAVWVKGANDRAHVNDNTMGDIVMITTNVNSGADSSMVVGTINYQTGAIDLDMGKFKGGQKSNLVTETWYWTMTGAIAYQFQEYDYTDYSNSYVKVSWTSKQPDQGLPQTYYLSDPESASKGNSRGRLREGMNMFTAFVDMDGNGVWSAGEPFGAISDIDVGWSSVAPFTLELTDTNPSILRVDLATAIAAGAQEFAEFNQLTDRGLMGAYYDNVGTIAGTNIPPVNATRVRVVRSLINGYPRNGTQSYSEVVFDDTFDLTAHGMLSEADLRARGILDLDWDQLRTRWALTHNNDLSGLTSLQHATYRIVIGSGSVADESTGVPNNKLSAMFVTAFEPGSEQTPAVPLSPAGIVAAGQPTFRWTHRAVDADGVKIKDYPAFRLRVWTTGTRKLVYDSGDQPAPARDANGVYSWTPPLYADDVTPQGMVFSTTNNYTWTVSMLDAKFRTPNAGEVNKEFRMEASGNLGTTSDYGKIKVAVRYFGPGAATDKPAKGAKLVRVQAFTTPDFAGMPAGEGWVTNIAHLASTDNLEENASILGLPAGTYYVRAFLDTDGDGSCGEWESWGYANFVGTGRRDAYTVMPVVLKGQSVPKVTVYLEDRDTDFDGLPDVYEMEVNKNMMKSSPTGATFFTRVNPNLLAKITDIPAEATQYLAMGYLNALAMPDTMLSASAGLLLSDPDAETAAPETVTVAITAFSLADGIKLDIGTEVTGSMGDYLVVSDSAKVGVQIVASETADFANAKSVDVKDVVIRANAVTTELIMGEEVRKALEVSGVESAAFIKVRLVQK